jgi:peptidoglycan/xylan/chitin deacetylase (PgdA/CDA1 family)
LLDALRDTGAQATFFLIDQHITPETEALVKRMADEGSAIGLHSGTRRLIVMAPDELAAVVQTGRGTHRSDCGASALPPVPAARGLAKSFDVRRPGSRLVYARRLELGHVGLALVAAAAGDIVVIHDGHHVTQRADRRHAAETVRLLVPHLRSRGFRFGRMCGTAPDDSSKRQSWD